MRILIPYCRLRTYSFAGGTKLDDVFLMNSEAVVQDLGSQSTALIMKQDEKIEPKHGIAVLAAVENPFCWPTCFPDAD